MTTGKEWIKQTNVYEVNLRQYTREGTINAFLPHLARLRQMGVHTLWFMPVTRIAQQHKKGTMGSYYAAASYTEVDTEFGTFEDFRNLVREAQAFGFKIILDWVANHTGWDHEWTLEHPEWYERDELGVFKAASGMDDIIELDFTNTQMRAEMIRCMKYWVEEAGIDGFRCDLAFWVELDFWVQAKKELDQVKPLFWLAEADAWEHPEYMRVFDAAYTWKWMRAAEDIYHHGGTMKHVMEILDRYQALPGMPAWFTTNHDENSWNGTEYEKYGDAALLLAVFTCTWPGIPLLYSGQEIPNKRRLAFFDKDLLEWNHPLQLQDFYAKLLNLQTSSEALHFDASFHRIHTSADELALGYMRSGNDKAVMVLLNFSARELKIDLYDERAAGIYRNLFTDEVHDLEQRRLISLQAWGYLVLCK